LVQLVLACSGADSGVARFMAVGLGLTGAVAGIISMAIFVHLKDNDDAFTVANKVTFAYGFWLLVVAWVFTFLASIPFARSK
jgi:membrane associated rhomboid family serine protease